MSLFQMFIKALDYTIKTYDELAYCDVRPDINRIKSLTDAIKKALKKLDEFEKELKVLEKNEKILELVAKAKDASGDEKIKLLEEIERIIYSYGI